MSNPIDDFLPLVSRHAQQSLKPLRLEKFQVISTTAAGAVRVRDALGVEKPVDWPRLKSSAVPPAGAYVLCAVQGRSIYVLGELAGI